MARNKFDLTIANRIAFESFVVRDGRERWRWRLSRPCLGTAEKGRFKQAHVRFGAKHVHVRHLTL